MASGPRLVHKQFNSPIGLYSQQNIQETLNKHLHTLDNGGVGIDFNDPSTGKPGNLANSAVLRMLEEEERTRKGYPKLDPTQIEAILETMPRMYHPFDQCWPPARLRAAKSWDGGLDMKNCFFNSDFLKAHKKDQKKVVWPPVPETNGYHSPQNQQQQQAPANYNNAQQQQSPSAPQQPQSPQYAPKPQYQVPAQQFQTLNQNQPSSQNQQPSYCEGKRQEQPAINRLIPVGAGVSAAPVSPRAQARPEAQPYRPTQQSRWAPVPAPLSPQPNYASQPPSYPPQQQQYPPQQQQYPPQQQQFSPQPQYSPQQPQFSPQQPQYSPQPQQQQPQYSPQSQQQQFSQQPDYQQQQYQQQQYQQPQRQFEPPPTTVTLRQHTPIHQRPPPVFASQPAAASFQGGVNMRGDQKWPPQDVREAVAAENEVRKQIAKGPACRPRKVKKDYAAFFAQNALNSNYPGYRAPPGTQHFEDHSGQSTY